MLSDVAESPARKLLIARLYNAGVRMKTLSETFEFDPKTIRRWGQALRHGDAEALIRVLEGRSSRRKRTALIESFVRLRLPELLADRRYGAVKRLREEIKTVFRINISGKSLGALIRELKTPSASVPEAASPTAVIQCSPDGGEKGEITSPCSSEGSSVDVEANPLVISSISDGIDLSVSDNKAKLPPSLERQVPPNGQYWCDHAGLLIFAASLIELSVQVEPAQPILAQWLSSLLLGAQNIEQTKFFNWENLELLLGQVVRLPLSQREELKTLGTEATLAALFSFNADRLKEGVGTDFYFDPHTKHYTGEQNVLKGWCAKIRWADKILQSDFIHTAGGAPIYFETTDNFEDLRDRFFGVTQRARAILKWPAERVVTYVVDRGIFSAEVFEKILADPIIHLITWQKGFVAETWNSAQVSGSLTMTRARNRSDDLRTYHFEYRDQVWETHPRLRQLIVQATNDKGRVVQVAILTDDTARAAKEIILLMFHRWLQENDFKYLDKHFGINQITSYRVIEYDPLRDQVKDRQIKSSQRKLLDQRRQKVRRQQARLLVVQEAAEHKQRQRELRASQLKNSQEPASGTDPKSKVVVELEKLRVARGRQTAASQTRGKTIQQLSQTLSELDKQISEATQTESRLESMIAAQMVRMEPQSKRLLDALRIIARNLFYQAIQPFKKAYDNLRDDHDYFRNLTRSPGVLEFREEEIVVHLMPTTRYAPAMKRIITGVMEGLTRLEMRFPNGGQRKLRFRLGAKSEIRVQLELDPE